MLKPGLWWLLRPILSHSAVSMVVVGAVLDALDTQVTTGGDDRSGLLASL